MSTRAEVVSLADRVRCDIRTSTGGPCGKVAQWELDCHGCTGGPVCSEHLRGWRRGVGEAMLRGGGTSACAGCGRKFSSVDEAGTATALSAAAPSSHSPGFAKMVERRTVAESPATVSPLLRYETHMRGAGRSGRWIYESLWTLGRLEEHAARPVGECSADDVSRFLAAPALGAGSRATYFRQINSFYRWWRTQGGMHITAELPSPREPRTEPRPISTAQLRRLLDANMHRRTRVMVLLAAFAGLRVHEIAKVHGEDIDLDRRTITVTGKGGVTATVPLHPILIEASATMPSHGFWFPANSTRPHEHVQGKSVSAIIGQAMRRAEIPGTPHKLRHWFGTTLMEDGADMRTVQTLLRHASLTTTARYTLVTDERRVEAVDRLSVLGPETDQ